MEEAGGCKVGGLMCRARVDRQGRLLELLQADVFGRRDAARRLRIKPSRGVFLVEVALAGVLVDSAHK